MAEETHEQCLGVLHYKDCIAEYHKPGPGCTVDDGGYEKAIKTKLLHEFVEVKEVISKFKCKGDILPYSLSWVQGALRGLLTAKMDKIDLATLTPFLSDYSISSLPIRILPKKDAVPPL